MSENVKELHSVIQNDNSLFYEEFKIALNFTLQQKKTL